MPVRRFVALVLRLLPVHWFVMPSGREVREMNEQPIHTGTQCQAILAHLLRGESITALEALDLFGCNRLAARVDDLKKQGWPIRSQMIEVPSGKRVARYTLDWNGAWSPHEEDDDHAA